MKKFISAVILICCSVVLNAQDILYKDFKWSSYAKVTNLSPADTADFELVIFEKRVIEYAKNTEGEFKEYYFVHQRIRVNSDEAIERNNKIYLPLSSSVNAIEIKARTISPDGKVKELNKSDVIEVKEDGKTIKYFALEGIEKGSEIEYYFLLEMSPRLSGVTFYFQSKFRKLNFEFELIHPNHLVFKSKSLNGFPELKKDSVIEHRTVLRTKIENLPALKSEEYASFDPHKMGISYKLHGNTETNRFNVISYDAIAENVFSKVYNDYKKNTSSLKKFVKKLELLPTDDTRLIIRKLEKHIKSKFLIFPWDFPHKNLKSALSAGIVGETDLLRIYAQTLKFLGIEHQIVMTCDRYDKRFDPEFESFNYLEDYLIYIPSIKLYIAPTEQLSRMEFIHYGYYNNCGLFLIPVAIGAVETATAKVKFIEPIAENLSTDSLVLNCDFNSEMEKLNISYTRSVRGYNAKTFQPVWDLLEESDIKEIEKDFPSFLSSNKDEVEEIKVYNAGADYFPETPFKTTAKLSCEKFIDQAGEKYLFKIGELIGQQAELYQDRERKMEIENYFNHSYHRTIIFTIPEGYKVNGLEALNMKVVREKNGVVTMGFVSSYKVEGNKIIVTCDEFYREITLPVSEFESFRAIINAAADFNKITLFVEKK